MKKIKRGETVYYSSLTDDMIPHKAVRKGVGRKKVPRILEAILYRGIALPIAYFYCRLGLGQKIVGRERLPRHGGYVLMLNHTEPVGDAFTPPLVTHPAHCHTLVHPDNTAIPVIGRCLPYLGAITLPHTLSDVRAMYRELEEALARGRAVAIYPEARVWPGCSFIRPLERGAFDVALRLGVPVYTATRVYFKARRKIRATVYVDGPFYPPEVGDKRQRAEALCQIVGEAMARRAAESDTVAVDYRPMEDK